MGSRIWGISIPKWVTLTFVWRSFKVMSSFASHSPWNISEIVRDRGLVPIGNGLWQIEWPCDQWRHRHVTWKVKLVTPIRLEPNISTTAGNVIAQQSLITNLLWGSTVGHLSDSLASCLIYCWPPTTSPSPQNGVPYTRMAISLQRVIRSTSCLVLG